jgi:hypothetical protein
MELARDQRQRHPGHENHKALEEFACSCQHPDAPLHRRHGKRLQPRTIGPYGPFVDIVLHGAGRVLCRRICIRHIHLLHQGLGATGSRKVCVATY